MNLTGITVPAKLRPVFEQMDVREVVHLTIKDLKDLGCDGATALSIFNAARKQAQTAVVADLEDDPVTLALHRLANAPKPSARLAEAAEQIDARAWLVLSAAGKMLAEASAAELKRLQKGLPEREVTTDGYRVVAPRTWAATAAETVLLHPWRSTPLEDDGTDPNTGVSWADEVLWLRAAVASPEAGLAESAIAAQLKEPMAPWARAAVARVAALEDDARMDLLRGRKRKVHPAKPPPVEDPITTAPAVQRHGAAAASWATTGTPFKRLVDLFTNATSPDELKCMVMGLEGGRDVANQLAWNNPSATVYADLVNTLQRHNRTGDLLRAMLPQRRQFEPEIRAVASAYGIERL